MKNTVRRNDGTSVREKERGGKQIEGDGKDETETKQCYRTVASCRRTVVPFGQDRGQRHDNRAIANSLVIFFRVARTAPTVAWRRGGYTRRPPYDDDDDDDATTSRRSLRRMSRSTFIRTNL